MFIVGLLSWWYGAGWKQSALGVRDGLAGLYDYFSFDLLLKTLFLPFRQISAGQVRGSFEVQMHAWFDRLISRTIGAIVRSIVIVVGSVTMVIAAVIGILRITFWPLVPVLPVIGIILAASGWVPWKI